MKNYHPSLSLAIEEATEYAYSRGFYIYNGDAFSSFIYGGVPYGKTIKESIELLDRKTAKISKKYLHVQIYRMDNGTYELNCYIN